MKRILLILLLVFVVGSFLMSESTGGSDYNNLSIEGTSNIHDWVSSATEMTVEGVILIEENVLKDISEMKVEIPVKSIISTKGSIMDKKTWKALDYKDHPTINYELTDIISIKNNEESFILQTSGDLTMAGTTKNIDMQVTATLQDNNTVQFTGEKEIEMTSMNIDPPTALLGTLKTGNKVTIKFDIVLKNIDGKLSSY